jgi:nitroimidazol reductase NimA-like FMN-containing flavoprotein (pyridoxamine 5'-phosphate oxidase superfamily)
MLGKLTELQIDNLLLSQAVGRIGCCKSNKPYIVPVTYVYDGKYIIGQTTEGLKLDIMRKNPQVCFEVDVMTDMTNWQSVVVWGTFEELHGNEEEKEREYLFNRVMHLMTSQTIHTHEHEVISEVENDNRVKPVMYRIRIKEKTGRFEKI